MVLLPTVAACHKTDQHEAQKGMLSLSIGIVRTQGAGASAISISLMKPFSFLLTIAVSSKTDENLQSIILTDRKQAFIQHKNQLTKNDIWNTIDPPPIVE
jgi:hypothetical protein